MESTTAERSFVSLGARSHDSLQYHVMCDDGRVFTARVFQTGSASKEWAWIYADGAIDVLVDAAVPTRMSQDAPLVVDGTLLTVQPDGGGISRVEVRPQGADGFVLELEAADEMAHGQPVAAWDPQRFYWQPDVATVVHHRGEELPARAFVKRYTWHGNAPHYWAYRMLSGHLEDGGPALWTADALFQDVKHGNFNVLPRDGKLWSGDPAWTFHNDMRAVTFRDGAQRTALMQPLAQTDLIVGSGEMDTRLTQWPVRFTYVDDAGREANGLGIYEYACGTLG